MKSSFFSRRSFIIILVMMFMLPVIFAGTRRALRTHRNDVRDWLPEDFPQTADHRWFREHFPHEQFVLLSWPGCTLDDPRIELLARKLVPHQLPPWAQQQAQQSDQQPPTVPALAASPAAAGTGNKPAEPHYFKRVLTGPRLIYELQQRYENLSREEILERLEGSLIGKDHYRTCLVVTLNSHVEGKQLHRAIEQIHQYAQQCNIEDPAPDASSEILPVRAWNGFVGLVEEMIFGRAPPPEKRLILGGPPVDNVAIDKEGQRTLMRLAGLSAVVGLGISMACLHSWRLTLLVFWTALLAAGLGLSAVYFSGQSVDAVMLSMPSLVYVLAISGAIHIINYYHDAIRDGGLNRALERAVRFGWSPCFLAAFTTALGLGSLYLSHVVPISKFGVYSAVGVMATLLLLFLLLPALLHYFPSRKFAEQYGGKGHTEETSSRIEIWWRRTGVRIVSRNLVVAAGCLALMIVCAIGLSRVRTTVKLMKFFSADAPIIHDYAWLEKHLGPLVPMEVVLRFDNETCPLTLVERMRIAQEVEEAVETLAPVGGALSAATFAPNLLPEVRRPSAMERMMGIDPRRVKDDVLNKRLEKHRAEFHDYLAVEGDPSLKELGLGGVLAARLETAGLSSLRSIEHWAAGDPIAQRLTELPGVDAAQASAVEQAIRGWQAAHGVELLRVSTRVEALSDLDYGKFIDDLKAVVEPVLDHYRAAGVEGIGAVYTGLVPLVYQVQHELMRGLFNSLALAFVLIAFVMMVVLRNPAAGLLAMLPNLFPVVVIFGAMGWLGILVDVGTMMTASVALGVAVDDTLHYLTWFRRGLSAGRDHREAAIFAYRCCATAMTQTTLVAGLGLAVFAFSTFTPTQRFGVLMLVLLGVALVGDLIYLPALLTGPLGRLCFRCRSKPSPQPEAAARQADDAEPVVLPVESPPGQSPHLRSYPAHRSSQAS